MKPFKGPAKQRGFLSALLSGATALQGLLGADDAVNQGREDILNLPGMQGPTGIGGNFGQVSAGGQFTGSQQFQDTQNQLAAGTAGMLGGGLFNNQGFQNAFNQNDIAGALGQANQAFGQQSGNTAFGGLGQLQQMLQGQVSGGPQDFSGGLQNQLFSAGFGNQQAAGDQSALFNQSLAAQRAAFAPQQARQQQALESSLFSKGLLGAGSSATGEGFRGLFEAQGAQDLAFQNNAFGQAQTRSNFLAGLGSQQIGQGQNFLNQNLGQFNQNIGNLQGIEGQAFNQNLQGLNFNSQQGSNRLNAAQGLFGLGNDVFAQSFGLGLGGADSLTGMNQFGLDAARSPQELQAQLLQGSGQMSQPLVNSGEQRAGSQGGLFGGLSDAFGGGTGAIGGAVSAIGDLFSDERLKDNVELVGIENGHNVYTWDWNAEAEKVGASNSPNYGVIAQEVMTTDPDAVSIDKSGYFKVDYSQIGVV